MSVIVHGMDVPKDCPQCPLAHYTLGTGQFMGCSIVAGKKYAMNDEEYANSTTRPDWCPLEERKCGKWIDHYGDTLCSECKTVFKELEYLLDDGYPKYCPNCGAKME